MTINRVMNAMRKLLLLSAMVFSVPAYSLEECSFFSLEKNIEEVQSRKAKGNIKDLLDVTTSNTDLRPINGM